MQYTLFFVCLLLGACTTGRMTETVLYFGQAKPGGGMVTESEWNRFKEERVAAVFKEGSTVVSATGHWFDPDKRQLITEPTYLVVHYHKPSKQLSRQIDSLRYWYKSLFQQQSVLRVDRKAKASF